MTDKFKLLAKSRYDNAFETFCQIAKQFDDGGGDLSLADTLSIAFDITLQYSLLQLKLLDSDVDFSAIKLLAKTSGSADLTDFTAMAFSMQNYSWDDLANDDCAKLPRFISSAGNKLTSVFSLLSDALSQAENKLRAQVYKETEGVFAALLNMDEITSVEKQLFAQTEIFKVFKCCHT